MASIINGNSKRRMISPERGDSGNGKSKLYATSATASAQSDVYLTDLESVKRIKINSEPPTDIGFVDVQKLDYSIRTIQKNLKNVIEDVPNITELTNLMDSNVLSSSTLSDLQQNKFIWLASQLKTKYILGQAPIIDDIIKGLIDIDEKDLQQLQEMSKDKPQQSFQFDKSATPQSNSSQGSDYDGLPRLPTINDTHLYERVFIHRSALNHKYYLDQDELLQAHNERLEFLGDSVLNNLVTLILYDRYPNATEGSLTKMRSHLIDNKTLAVFAHGYGFNYKLRTNIEQSILDTGDQKIFADVFEAYVGALSMEAGLDLRHIKKWLHKLYQPKLDAFDEDTNLKPINKEAKSALYSLIGSAQLHPVYELVVKGDGVNKNFEVECRIKGDVLGRGGAPNQRDAGLRAAMQALNNKPMLEKYFRLRSASDPSETVISQKQLQVQERIKLKSSQEDSKVINFKMFPIQVDTSSDLLQNDAKNDLYARLGKTIGVVPEYIVSDTPDGKFQVDLKIKGFLVAQAKDSSKKKVMTKAAMAVLNNEEAMAQIYKM